jgi:hypothetical protein
MNRTFKLLTFVGALALTAGACADPAAGITADDSVASQAGGMLGSGTRVEEDECLAGGYIGSGNVTGDCPPPPQP